MTTQPKALRLADELTENADLDSAEGGNPAVCQLEWDAAAELRRLHAEVEALRYELKAEQALSFRRQVAELEAEVEMLRADSGLMRGGIGG